MVMDIELQEFAMPAVKVVLTDNGKEIGRGFLYIMKNELHQQPGKQSLVGYIEDVFLDEEYRKQQLGKKIVEKIIDEAKKRGCYKLIGTSRYGRDKLHAYYESMGFKDHGKEFRLDL